MSANTLFLIHLASVGVPAFASFVLSAKCLEIAQDLPLAADEPLPRTSLGIVFRAARTARGWWYACGFVVAQVALFAAFYWWVS